MAGKGKLAPRGLRTKGGEARRWCPPSFFGEVRDMVHGREFPGRVAESVFQAAVEMEPLRRSLLCLLHLVHPTASRSLAALSGFSRSFALQMPGAKPRTFPATWVVSEGHIWVPGP